MTVEDSRQWQSQARDRARTRRKSAGRRPHRVPTRRPARHLQVVPSEPAPLATTAPQPKPVLRRRPVSPPMAPPPGVRTLRWGIRLLVGGIGSTVLAGTCLSYLGGTPYNAPPSNPAMVSQVQDSLETIAMLPLGEEMTPLADRIAAIAAQAAPLDPRIFVIDLDTGAYVNHQGGIPVPAASTIKLPILVAFFQDVESGKIDPQEQLVMEEADVAGGAGNLRHSSVGTRFTALETATRMITISDNTATNMLIRRMGGAAILNQRFASWGLNATAIHERLPDLTGQNQTSPLDLANLLVQVNRGELVSLPRRDQLLGIMRQVKNRALLPRGLDNKATIAHKTGNIKAMLADAGIVDTAMGRRYAVVVMVQRPENDAAARGLIQTLSREVYRAFEQPLPTPSAPVPPVTEPPKVEANTQPFP